MPIKAAMVTPNLTLGGAERWVVDLIKHSDPDRVRWTGCAISGWGGLDRNLGTELRQYTRLYCNRIPEHLRTSKFPFASDLVHKWTSMDFRKAVSAAAKGADVILTWGAPNMLFWFKKQSVPRVICSHTTLKEEHNAPIQGITHLTAVSEAAMGYFAGRDGYDELPKQVIYNGADPNRVCSSQAAWRARKQIRKYWGKTTKDVVIGYLGRQSPEKNPFAPALAIRTLPKNYSAIYYGNGPQGNGFMPELTAFCAEHIHGRYQMYSPVPCVGDILVGFDVLVLASQREAFSLALIEAWLNGVPVVATPVGSLPELERKYGKLVFAVPHKPSEQDLREAVERAMEPKLRKEVVDRARQVAWQEFTIQAMADRWMTYLEEIV